MQETVREVLAVAERQGLDIGARRGGTIVLARTAAQERRARAEVAHARAWDQGPEDLAWLDADAARARLDASGVRGATYTPHCAAVHPRRLVDGLATLVERAGGTIHEHSPVTRIAPGVVTTPHGQVRAPHVVRATEGYTARLPGLRRAVVPVYSLVLATAPLDAATWERIGLAERETFTDHRHLVVYGQRTADDRLVFGGRGAPYHLGSAIQDRFDTHPRVHAALRRTLVDMFPLLRDVTVTHTWGGPLGIPRDWCASVGLDGASGLAWAGGYVGDGVATANLAGRTLRDLLLGHDTALTRLPWVDHVSPRWEPEPLRWAGVNAGLRAATLADLEERLTRRPSVVARALAPLTGH